jgi:N6-adenosine-specific RNA methylase IME4
VKQYGLILADPPWRNRGNGRARKYYSFMSPAAICDLPVAPICAEDCVLLLWSTWAELGNAMAVIEAWGFTYMSGFPWIKLHEPPFTDATGSLVARVVYGTGFWVRGCSEPVLIGWRGETKPPSSHFLGLLSERLEHSRKPDDIYEYAESFPGPYLELFARRNRPGWDVWGDEVDAVTLPGFPTLSRT